MTVAKLVYFLFLVSAVVVHSCGEDNVTGPCACTDNNLSGDVRVEQNGCGNHLGDSCFCYVRNPERCTDMP